MEADGRISIITNDSLFLGRGVKGVEIYSIPNAQCPILQLTMKRDAN